LLFELPPRDDDPLRERDPELELLGRLVDDDPRFTPVELEDRRRDELLVTERDFGCVLEVRRFLFTA